MTGLEKIKALLEQDGMSVSYGAPGYNVQENGVTLSVAESVPVRRCLSDKIGASYRAIRIDVYCSDYLAGYNRLEQIKTKIDNAEKTTMKIVRVKDLGTIRDTSLNKNVLSVLYKELI